MAEDGRRTLSGLIRAVQEILTDAAIPEAALDGRLIVEHVTATTRTDAVARPDRLVDPGQAAAAHAAVARRVGGEPVHRILGWRDFHGLRLSLSAETLEPRQDTEAVVEAVLPSVLGAIERFGTCRILDLGTGTGAIALALLKEARAARADGADISEEALRTAVRNATAAGLSGRFRPVLSDWYSATEGRYHVIVSNPPYIRTEELGALQREVRQWDPIRALDGGTDGLNAFRTIAAGASLHLEVGGRVAVEIGYDQKCDVVSLFGRAGFRLIESKRDLPGQDRALVFGR